MTVMTVEELQKKVEELEKRIEKLEDMGLSLIAEDGTRLQTVTEEEAKEAFDKIFNGNK
ncbi:hypothetical protein [Hungatella hathewayi]|uniref:hypothetical protein n=1 Tax=Hungatella hathewayi TaxID=154046 RepID=UPI0035671F8B